jgi:hypothetical protein
MKKLFTKSAILTLIWLSFFSVNITNAVEDPGFEIIPWATSSNIWTEVNSISVWWSVWDKYKDIAYGKKTEDESNTRVWSDRSLGDQFASGIMTWDTILDYAVYLVKFVWQLALLAWALWIIYFGYKKATEHLKFNWTLWKIVLGILVISFAYVIIKMVWSMFVS